jgi:two-component system, NtrC family, sensor histidine kinase PilS
MTSPTPRVERRRRPRLPHEAWFGATGTATESKVFDKNFIEPPESHFDLDWNDLAGAGAEAEAESNFLTRQAQRIVDAGQTAFQRIYLAFISARAALGLALMATLMVGAMFGVQATEVVVSISAMYASVAIVMWLMPRIWPRFFAHAMARLRAPQWVATIGLDIICFLFLHVTAPASTLNYVALLVLPVLMAGVLTPRLWALGTVSIITLLLLAVAWIRGAAGGDTTLLLTQAALASCGFFVMAILAGELAGRLAREELTAKASLELARQQAQLNRLVIEEMQEGVLVVDRRGRVRTNNPAARGLLHTENTTEPIPQQLRSVPAWGALVRAVERAFAEGQWPEAGRDVVLQFEAGPTRTLRVRVRFTRRRESKASEELCVLFLEDVRSMQARIRQEKLAAMGRVSAGIAHEIRNPLAAIAQANALMAEDATTASSQQLTRMVTENVERLKRIVDDVMEVASGELRSAETLDATAFTASACAEWVHTAGLSLIEANLLQLDLPSEPLGVVFDGDHLRRVLVNLLDNARRHGSGLIGCVQVRLRVQDEQRVLLSVLSDGTPISPDVERYLFEPFFSTRSRGTGLGLYICRELCERYGARIDYRLRDDNAPNRNEFFVAMMRQPLPPNR